MLSNLLVYFYIPYFSHLNFIFTEHSPPVAVSDVFGGMIGNQSNTEDANNETNQTQHANENTMSESPPSPGNPFNPGPAGPSGIKFSNSNEVKTISNFEIWF